MIQTRHTYDKTCVGCGIVFRPRNELDHRWRDHRYCSSTCQRRAGSTVNSATVRRPGFAQGLGSIDGSR